MRLRPETSNVADMAEASNSRLLIPSFYFPFRDRSRICWIRRARDQERSIRNTCAQQPMRCNQRAHSLVREQSADKAEGRRAGRFGKRCETIHIDTRSGDKRNATVWKTERH